jgi:branched-chain amino acid transport system substrate-binding protein
MKIVAQTINELKSAESPKIIEHFEKGTKFELLKTRPGYFRGSDHQLMHEMYAVTALPGDKIKNQWDIFSSSPAVPGPTEDLEVIAATKEENSCTFPS